MHTHSKKKHSKKTIAHNNGTTSHDRTVGGNQGNVRSCVVAAD